MEVINAADLRNNLKEFSSVEPFLPNLAWQSYLQHYGLLPLLDQCKLSVGVEAMGDVSLVAQLYKQVSLSKGTVVLMHGYMDHVGLYSKLITFLVEQGWDVLCYDLPGHGLSTGDSHAIHQFSEYATQLELLISRHHAVLNEPRVFLGQSTGGAIILEHQRLYALHDVACRILLAPLVRPVKFTLIRIKYFLLRPFINRVTRYFSVNSHDESFLSFIREDDPLQKRWVSVDWIGAMLEWVNHIEAVEPQLANIHVIQGTEDDTVDWQHNLAVLQRIYPEIQTHLIPQGRHHLANESPLYRDQVYHQVGEALNSVK